MGAPVHIILTTTVSRRRRRMDGGEEPSLAPSASHPSEVQLFIYGFVLVLIPTATILGNVLVIISVLRFKSLHSAINFLILGLAIADLMVALFVMPYAVYVYVQGGRWLLGQSISPDVACSTASIILLALISFDRYQAISHPIQYSRQAQNIARVVRLFVGVWVYSLLVASPIVLGFNDPPPADNTSGVFEPFECRFYSPWFSLLSSLVSFLLPCCVVIFVYVRIIRALRRRERAAKARKQAAANSAAQHQQATASGSESVRDANSDRRENELIGRCQLLSPCAGSVDWSAPTSRKNSEMPRGNVPQQRRHRQQHVTARRGALSFPLVRRIALGRDIRVNHYLLNDGEDTSEDLIVPERTTTTTVLHMSNGGGRVLLGEAEVQSVQRQNVGGESPKTRNGAFFGSVSFRGPSLAVPSLPPFRRGNSAIELGGRRAAEDDDSKELAMTTSARMANDNATKEAEQNERARNTVVLSTADTVPNPLPMPKAAVTGTVSLGTEKPPPPARAAVAQQQSEQGSRRDRHASLRRKVHKSQRKEKRATKRWESLSVSVWPAAF
uniref:G_PROTEIN_RECEP_F1_2 domain-containing protein n=1 Tax=Globodera pallida TaxID=36090 RepID=A0A183BWY1_GLOPA